MTQDAAATAAKSIATGGLAASAFGLTWWALAAALVGAAASLHFERETPPQNLVRTLTAIASLGFLAALLASLTTHVPSLLGFSPAEVPIAVRAGLLGLFANPIYKRLRREADTRGVNGG